MNTLQSNDSRLLSRGECVDVMERILSYCTGEGRLRVEIGGWWNGELKWARNRVWVAADRRDLRIEIARWLPGDDTSTKISLNQSDDVSLKAAVKFVEENAHAKHNPWRRGREDLLPPPPPLPDQAFGTAWSDATYDATADDRARLASILMNDAEKTGMLSAGYLEMRGAVNAVIGEATGSGAWDFAQLDLRTLRSNDTPPMTYNVFTQAQCSMTVRHPQGQGSGWAGLSGFDWSKIDSKQLADIALKKCLASLNPVRIEPGRYTVILEPQAMCDLLEPMMISFNRVYAEKGKGPWAYRYDTALNLWRTKLGMKVVDERVTISHDPDDPMLGGSSVGHTEVAWIKHGFLQMLEFGRTLYALPRLNQAEGAYGSSAFRMSGGKSSIDEMISTTKRGLLVTRLSGLRTLEGQNLLSTGMTRDGLWLIENGAVSKAVHNMRFTESPIFVLNQLEDLGIPVPIFRPTMNPYIHQLQPAIVPPVKARDFSFTSLVDAI